MFNTSQQNTRPLETFNQNMPLLSILSIITKVIIENSGQWLAEQPRIITGKSWA